MSSIDLGTHPQEVSPAVKTNKKVKYYPSFTVEKDIDVKLGTPVVCSGVVSGLRRDKYGNSVSVELRSMKINKKVSEKDFEKMSDDEQRKVLEKEVG